MSPKLLRVVWTLLALLAAAQTSGQTTRVEVVKLAPLFVTPYERPEALAMAEVGVELAVLGTDGDWYLVEYDSRRFGRRRGHIHRDNVKAVRFAAPTAAPAPAALAPKPPAAVPGPVPAPKPTAPSAHAPTTTPDRFASKRPAFVPNVGPASAVTAGVPVKLNAYIDWNRGDHLIVEGQRVRWTVDTRLKGLAPSALSSVPAGLEAKVTGLRAADGTVWADSIELKKNGLALFEKEVIAVGHSQEESALRAGSFLLPVSGRLKPIGTITTSGPDVERCRRIMARLLPPAHQSMPNIYVVESDLWNAMVMPNGAVWVFRGLLSDVRSDDELAAVLGHELAHFTHEHQRKEEKQSIWIRLAELGAVAAIGQIDSPTRREAAAWGAIYALNAWSNGYNRDHEAQADRVGLRYAFEGGFDVSAGPRVWRRKAEEGDLDQFTAFFFSTHPRSQTRVQSLEREIAFNYSTPSGAR